MNSKPIIQKRKKTYNPNQVLDDTFLMELEEVAKLLGKTPQTIRNWCAKRIFPFVRVGNKHLFKRASVLNWIEKQEFLP